MLIDKLSKGVRLFPAILLVALLFPPAALVAQQPSAQDVERKVDAMLSKLSLAEKIELIHGVADMELSPAMPKIGLPALRTSDGPMGVRSWGPSTAYAAGIGLAASWNRQLAGRVGASIGRDARARGVHILLGPGVNIYRAPMNGRNFEYFGEDPFLAGQIAAHYILGVQSQHVVATVKHYDANNSEFDRHNINAIIDERTLREIYLPAFEAAVKEGHVGAVVDSYNLINGEHATQNKYLNVDVLKEDWGFPGILMSDWDGTYDGVAAANAGLDVEMPTGKFMNAQTLLPAIEAGKVSVATIDDKVRRVLRVAEEFGFIDHEQVDAEIPLYNPPSEAVALASSLEGAVLLKNQGGLLPLDLRRVHTIAVIGPDAYPAEPTAGGSANVTAIAPVSFLQGLSHAAPHLKVLWSPGLKDAQTLQALGIPADTDRKQPGWTQQEWEAKALAPETKKIAALADVAVVTVGFDWSTETEGQDRTFHLPPGQEALIQAVASVNPRTVVVLTAGGSVSTAGWLEHVPALLDTWYAGSEGGTALAQLLLGSANPSGKLPISWWSREEDDPTFHSYYPAPGSKDVKYSEGVFVGYRADGRDGREPEFPFGFGLSYTRFAFSNLTVTPAPASADGPITVSFKVSNTGTRAGAEVAQVYVSDPSATVPRPERELKGFERVVLKPGESRAVTVRLNRRSLAYWDTASHQWKVDSGRFAVRVGDSSENTPLEREFMVK